MLFVDPRLGSAELAAPLRKRGLEVVDDEYRDADVDFQGRGVHGAPVEVGIEVKKLGELIESLRSGRLTGVQVPRMRGVEGAGDTPRYLFAYLLVIGDLAYDTRGMLMKHTGTHTFKPLPGHMTVAELFKRLHVLHVCAGVNWALVKNQRDAVRWIEALYHTWTDVDQDQHKSHLGAYVPPALEKMGTFAHVVGGIPHVGPSVVEAAQMKFKTIRGAVNASAKAWSEVTTVSESGKSRRLGLSRGEGIVKAVTEEAA